MFLALYAASVGGLALYGQGGAAALLLAILGAGIVLTPPRRA